VLDTVAALRGNGPVTIAAVASDRAGVTFVAGRTSATNLNSNTRPGGAADAFVARIARSGEVLSVTFLGGSGEEEATGLALDHDGNCYVTGWTTSSDFPVRNAFQGRLSGGLDAFAAKLDNTGALIYATYLGGSADDEARGIAVDDSGAAYITGTTVSQDFPFFQAAQFRNGGGRDAFVVKLGPTGAFLDYATYLGGSGDDWGQSIAVDAQGRAFVAGKTASADFPGTSTGRSFAGGTDAFVTAISPEGRIAFGYLAGGSGSDEATGVAVDAAGRVYVVGATDSADFPLMQPFQAARGGATDAFIFRLDPAGNLEFSSYLGGEGEDHATGIALSADGVAQIAGWTSSAHFPMRGEFALAGSGAIGGFAARIADGQLVESTYTGGSGLRWVRAVAVDGGTGETIVGGDAAETGLPFGFVSRVTAAAVHSAPVRLTPPPVISAGRVTAPGSGGSVAKPTPRTVTTKDANPPTVSPGSASFGTVVVNTTATQVFTITNTGSSSLIVTGFSASGTGFSITNPPTLPATVPANGTLTFTVLFAPSIAGSYSGSFTVSTATEALSGMLTGTGFVPAGCIYSLSALGVSSFGAAGGNGYASASLTGTGCPNSITATSNAPWLAVIATPPGSASAGTIAYKVVANSGAGRNGTITFGTATLGVSQSAGNTCSYTLSATSSTSFSASGGQGALAATASDPSCGLTPTSSVPWIAVGVLPPGTSSSGTVQYTVLANAGGAPRAGTLTLGSQAVNVTQAAGPATVQSWQEVFPANSPPATNAIAAYDSARQVTVLFNQYGQTWEWNGANWTQRSPAASPPARYYGAMAYDALHGQTVLFGGEFSDYLNDTWVWDGVNWTQVFPAHSPAARANHAMAYDAAQGQTVLFGGQTLSGAASDTWTWNGQDWAQQSPWLSPGGGSGYAMTFDSGLGEVILEGGSSLNTWAWDGTNWATVSFTGPSRSYPGLDYDAARDQVVLFGGCCYFGDTWAMSPSYSWTQQFPAIAPPARYSPVMVYDAARRQTLLFGGLGTFYFNDTWIYSDSSTAGPATVSPGAAAFGTVVVNTTATQVFTITNTGGSSLIVTGFSASGTGFSITNPPTLPAAIAANGTLTFTVAFTPSIAGSYSGSFTVSTATEALSGMLTGTGFVPPNCIYALSTLGASSFGAAGGNGYASASLTGTGCPNSITATSNAPWLAVIATPPGSASAGTIAYKVVANSGAGRNGTITFGTATLGVSQSAGNTCSYTLSATSSTSFSASGGQGALAATASDPSCGLTPTSSVPWIAVGVLPPGTSSSGTVQYTVLANAGGAPRAGTLTLGSQAVNVTQAAGPATVQSWQEVFPANSPPATNAIAAYDSARQVTVLFNQYGQTWEWNGANWTQRSPAASPPARYYGAMAYDALHGQTVLFGGEFSDYLNDTWVWDGVNWTQVFPAHSPAARANHAMAYDAAQGQTVLFGGQTLSGAASDTWTWNGQDWAQQSPWLSPGGGSGYAMTFDSGLGEVILEGGSSLNTWAWDGTNWATVSFTGPSRSYPGLDYDAARDQVVLFGGCCYFGDTWAMSPSYSWTQQFPAIAPPARYSPVMVYDAARRQTLLFGGLGTFYFNDTWIYSDGTGVGTTPTTFATSPAGLLVSVDGGAAQAAPFTVPLSQGSHTIAVAVAQAGSPGTRYIFSGWSDSGASSHSITVGASPATYTASFQTQYQLTTAASPGAGGTVSPPNGTFYAAGSVVSVQETPNTGYQFAAFSGGTLTGNTNPQNVTMNGPVNVVANFTPLAPNMTATVGARTIINTSTVQVGINLVNNGLGAATNATIASITGISVLSGSGTVSVASGTPQNLGTIHASGGANSTVVTFNWPSTATRATFTVNFTADGGYSGSATITTLR
jgi:hypothetical protein